MAQDDNDAGLTYGTHIPGTHIIIFYILISMEQFIRNAFDFSSRNN